MLKLLKIEKSFGEKKVLSDVSLTVEKGECVMLFGASGCGKTTLLRIAAGLEGQDGGAVEKSGKTAVVFAEPRLFPTVTVLENVTAVMRCGKKERKDAERRAAELSTGMAARVSLARAVAYDADVYLMDEPFKSLDAGIKQTVVSYLRGFLSDKTALIISHDSAEAALMGADVYRMENGMLVKPENA